MTSSRRIMIIGGTAMNSKIWGRMLEERRREQAAVPTERSAGVVWIERLCFAALVAIAVYLFFVLSNASERIRIDEHSRLEVVQTLLLAGAFMVFLLARSRSSGLNRVVATVCAILMGTGVLRELDVKTWPGPDWWEFLTHHGLQEVLLLGGGVFALIYLYAHRSYFAAIVGRGLTWFSWPFNVAVIVTFVGAYLLERRLRFLPQSQLLEEYAELAGYILFVVAAFRTLELAGRRASAEDGAASSP
jgi:hypothetical protein